jgi:hypothetical protein
MGVTEKNMVERTEGKELLELYKKYTEGQYSNISRGINV